jgi:hypothetical protein
MTGVLGYDGARQPDERSGAGCGLGVFAPDPSHVLWSESDDEIRSAQMICSGLQRLGFAS